MTNLVKAVIAVMKAVKNIDKSLNVGTGSNSYKGVSDKDVKTAFNNAMSENGLVIFPIDIQGTTNIERWEENSNYGKKTKQSVFTEVHTRYLLVHESGEKIELMGYGHGVDTQDKSAGKATTYAMKYALLYTFLTPTGSIDDSDGDHSDKAPVPSRVKPRAGVKVVRGSKEKEEPNPTGKEIVKYITEMELFTEWDKLNEWWKKLPAKVRAIESFKKTVTDYGKSLKKADNDAVQGKKDK